MSVRESCPSCHTAQWWRPKCIFVDAELNNIVMNNTKRLCAALPNNFDEEACLRMTNDQKQGLFDASSEWAANPYLLVLHSVDNETYEVRLNATLQFLQAWDQKLSRARVR